MKTDKLTDQQEFACERIGMASGHNLIEALPGTGKTSTLNAAISMHSAKFKIIYLVFSKAMAEEQKKVCKGAEVSTIDAFGWQGMNRFLKESGIKYNPRKLTDFKYPKHRAMFKAKLHEAKYETIKAAEKLVNFMYMNLIEPTDIIGIRKLIVNHGILLKKYEEKVIAMLPSFFRESEELCLGRGVSSLQEIAYLIVKLNIPLPKYDLVLVDEAQDLNRSKMEIVKMIGGIVTAVGDHNQAIMPFAGAMPDSMEIIRNTFDAKAMPLTRNWRCHTLAIDNAKKLMPAIEARPGAPEGELNRIRREDIDFSKISDDSMIICRRTAPCVAVAFELIRDGRKATLKGRDIKGSLLALDKAIMNKSPFTCSMYKGFLDDRLEQEEEEMIKKEYSERFIDSIRDKYDALKHFADDCDHPSDIEGSIYDIFKPKRGIELSTIHGSKGRQAPHIYIIEADHIRMNFEGMSPNDHITEECVEKVAITRPQIGLHFVSK